MHGEKTRAGRFAILISWLGHPLVFVLLSLAIIVLTQMPAAGALPILGGLFLVIILPTALLLFFGLRSGHWKDADVSVREERIRFYAWAIPISGAGVIATWLMRAPGFILRGGVVTFALFILAAIINARIKISLHTLFAFYCATILFEVGWLPGLFALGLASLVFWSRLFLGRHTLIENCMGLLLGLASGFVAAWT
jgi:hypothetical protein